MCLSAQRCSARSRLSIIATDLTRWNRVPWKRSRLWANSFPTWTARMKASLPGRKPMRMAAATGLRCATISRPLWPVSTHSTATIYRHLTGAMPWGLSGAMKNPAQADIVSFINVMRILSARQAWPRMPRSVRCCQTHWKRWAFPAVTIWCA